MTVLETARVVLRRLTLEDDAFMLGLLNEPAFLRFIGDRRVRTTHDARTYIQEGPIRSYETHGFGVYLVERKPDATPIGICGLLKRDTLDDVDVGFAFLPAYRSQGYAFESARAVLEHGRATLGLRRIVAITVADNAASIRLLERLGFRFERMVRLPTDAAELRLYASDGDAPPPAVPQG